MQRTQVTNSAGRSSALTSSARPHCQHSAVSVPCADCEGTPRSRHRVALFVPAPSLRLLDRPAFVISSLALYTRNFVFSSHSVHPLHRNHRCLQALLLPLVVLRASLLCSVPLSVSPLSFPCTSCRPLSTGSRPSASPSHHSLLRSARRRRRSAGARLRRRRWRAARAPSSPHTPCTRRWRPTVPRQQRTAAVAALPLPLRADRPAFPQLCRGRRFSAPTGYPASMSKNTRAAIGVGQSSPQHTTVRQTQPRLLTAHRPSCAPLPYALCSAGGRQRVLRRTLLREQMPQGARTARALSGAVSRE